ncbi:MAG TPA: acetoacetate--CoA ligase [Gemmatimonadaceae bacterium]|nr:acetoacetate--CoA ligase [Gemmatimonadaceae bacterium]
MTPTWVPAAVREEEVAMARFFRSASETNGSTPDPTASYADWHEWSCIYPAEFWSAVWSFAGVVATERAGGTAWDSVVEGFDRMAPPDAAAGPRWFRGARLNFAENLLRHRGPEPAIVFRGEDGSRRELSRDALAAEVGRVGAALRAQGIRPGDRVAGFLPNIPEAVIAMLATASCGAVWSSCSPDFGVKGVLDRFGQIAPRVLVAAEGYRYAGKELDCMGRVRDIVVAIPSIERAVIVPFLRGAVEQAVLGGIRNAITWEEFARIGEGAAPVFDRLPFDHPLYVMFSSGTTGLPKCMVHGAGGTLLQHLKEHMLHVDLREQDPIFYFTTCGWMMWNWLVSALATGATIVLYDGAPMPAGDPGALWRMAAEERLRVFGTSAKFISLSEKAALRPRAMYNLAALRTVLSTGSPLAAQGFHYLQREVGDSVHLASISGGTDIISCFALGNPLFPVWPGELQCAGLGMAVDVFDASGRPVREVPGELVCTRPFPSMPVAFWNDPGGAKYRAAYFEFFPGVWRHGDWAEWTAHGGLVIHGRSDATLNPGGVRIGTAEIYRQVDQMEEVVESVVIGQEIEDGAGGVDVRIVLFVRLRDGTTLDDALRQRIRDRIRENSSPHHVPSVIAQVADIPRTISGKITEMAVREVVHGREVTNADALANPEALSLFRNRSELGV